MSNIETLVGEIIPDIYDSIAREKQYPLGYNVAGSNQCHILTKALYIALLNRGIETRREHHKLENGTWHYVIAHTPNDAVPTEHDVITDLNPWQYMKMPSANHTFLHGTRDEVMDALRNEGAPDHIVGLRGLASVVQPHRLELM